MRIRLLHPEFFTDAVLARMPDFTRLVFAGLWLIADREGRLPDHPKMIDGVILPLDKRSCLKPLQELADAGRILRYQTPAGPVIQVVNFLKYQHPHLREKPSPFPGSAPDRAPDRALDTAPGPARGSTAASARDIARDQARNNTGLSPSVIDPVIVTVTDPVIDPVSAGAPKARPATNGSRPDAGRTQDQRRREAPDGRAGRAASAPVDEALLKKYLG